MNAAQVRARARMAMKRREEEIATDERESGEINLIPYLDIITNVVLFLLASITAGIILGTINTSLPEYAEGAAPGDNAANPNEPPIQLVAAVTKQEILLFSLSGLEGSVNAPKLKLTAKTPGLVYDYKQITDAAAEIVKRRWPGKPILTTSDSGKSVCLVAGAPRPLEDCRPDKATEVFLMVDGDIPYQVVVATMDSLRQAPDGTILFPGIIFSSGIQ